MYFKEGEQNFASKYFEVPTPYRDILILEFPVAAQRINFSIIIIIIMPI